MTQEEYGLELFKGLNPTVNRYSIKYYSKPYSRQLVYHWDKNLKFVKLAWWHLDGISWRVKKAIRLDWPGDLCDPKTHESLVQLIESFRHDIAPTS